METLMKKPMQKLKMPKIGENPKFWVKILFNFSIEEKSQILDGIFKNPQILDVL